MDQRTNLYIIEIIQWKWKWIWNQGRKVDNRCGKELIDWFPRNNKQERIW